METSSLIICRVSFGNHLVEVYEVPVNVLLKLHSNSCGRNINFSDDAWSIIFIQFEVPSQTFLLYLQVANMVNFVLNSHRLLAILPLCYFFLIA